MPYFGDIAPGQILYETFTTVKSTGAPETLTGTPVVSIYKDDGTGETISGVALIVNFDSLTGLNHLKIDTGADGVFFAGGHDYHLILTAGTVNGVSVVGYDVGHFSINNRSSLRPAVAGRTLDVDVNGTVLASAVQGGTVTISGSVPSNSDVLAIKGATDQLRFTVPNQVDANDLGLTASGIWLHPVRTLTNPQAWNLIGNVSGTMSAVINLVSGTQVNVSVTGVSVSVDPSTIWSYVPRTLTSPVSSQTSLQQGSDLTVLRGDTLVWSPSNLGSLANLSKLYFTVKQHFEDADSEAIMQIERTGGLLVLNKAPAASSSHGSIVVTDPSAGDITITLDAVETAKLDLLNAYYDIEFINTSGTVITLVNGDFSIVGDSTKATT